MIVFFQEIKILPGNEVRYNDEIQIPTFRNSKIEIKSYGDVLVSPIYLKFVWEVNSLWQQC